ncbi:MAG: TlpA family protein disulfide reductase [Planctomycetaceae bacterium]|jgi:thiol-disulfide isomerase/thioredoxin|nr:TlpA family protein disulfide reductase [Planctomycetaceae bacterium]
MFRSFSRIAVSACLVSFCAALPASAQDEPVTPVKTMSLDDVKNVADAELYLQSRVIELRKRSKGGDPKSMQTMLGTIILETGEKVLSLAKEVDDQKKGYKYKAQALSIQSAAGVEGAKDKLQTLIKELDGKADFQPIVNEIRFSEFIKGVAGTDGKAISTEEYDKFKADLKTWINKKDIPVMDAVGAGMMLTLVKAQNQKAYAEDMLKFLKSAECTVPEADKNAVAARLEGVIKQVEEAENETKDSKLAVGKDPELYGKTLDDKDFDWKSLRGKYVLIKFTATWCGPCKGEIPGMIDAYKKYKEKGLEIISVYVWERGADSVATVKKFVEEEKIDWIVLSETLTEKAGQPKQGESYKFRGVPTMVLVDKEGKIILTDARGGKLKAKLAEIFK